MFENWKRKFIANQDAKTQAARSKLEQTKQQERELEAELARVIEEGKAMEEAGAKKLAGLEQQKQEIISRGEAERKRRREEAEAEKHQLEAEIEELREQIKNIKSN